MEPVKHNIVNDMFRKHLNLSRLHTLDEELSSEMLSACMAASDAPGVSALSPPAAEKITINHESVYIV